MTPLRVGTRGSALALAQARIVAARLAAAGFETELVPIKTAGDVATAEAPILLSRGVFVTALQEALLAGAIDLAVHSAKDLPTGDRDDTALSFPVRGDARDALVGGTLAGLPRGARVATESPRRRAFLLHARPDLLMVPLRGNVDSRLEKLDAGGFEALVLAACGLDRLELAARIGERLSLDDMIPAVGQGALAVESRADDASAPWLGPLDDAGVRHAVRAERRFLAAMGGGCQAPFAAHARIEGGRMTMDGAALGADGREAMREHVTGGEDEGEALADTLAERLLARGAGRLAPGSAA